MVNFQIKDIVHVWEVGQLEETLVTSAIKGSSLTHSPRHITVVIMLDLSKPETLWYTLDKSLKILEASIKNAGIKHEVLNQLRQVKLKECQSSKDGESELKDKSSLFPLILCIIGGKYDLFKVSFYTYQKTNSFANGMFLKNYLVVFDK